VLQSPVLCRCRDGRRVVCCCRFFSYNFSRLVCIDYLMDRYDGSLFRSEEKILSTISYSVFRSSFFLSICISNIIYLTLKKQVALPHAKLFTRSASSLQFVRRNSQLMILQASLPISPLGIQLATLLFVLQQCPGHNR
jgi:hypothetical protein